MTLKGSKQRDGVINVTNVPEISALCEERVEEG